MLILTLIILAVSALIWYLKTCNQYFQKRKIPCEEPIMFFGNSLKMILGTENLLETICKTAVKYKDYKYVGFYKFLTPALIVNDVELIGNILVKDFPHFADNDVYFDEKVDFIMAKNLFVLKGQKWKTMKSLLTPMFTTSKLKSVYPLMEEVGARFAEFVGKEIKAGNADCIDGKALCTKFTTENVASSVFGLQSNAFVASEEEESEFVKVARDFGDPTLWNLFKLTLVFVIPQLNKFLKMKTFSKKAEDYLTGVIAETLKFRKENNIVRNDFLDMINSLKEKSTEYKMEEKDVIAQAAGFFIDGVETSASSLAYVLYELAANPDVQEKARREILDLKERHQGRISYEHFIELEYLDCVINETLRRGGPGIAFFKICTKDYELPSLQQGGDPYIVRKGDTVMIPVDAIHYNPEYFPEPEKFIPDRFFNENKNHLVKHTFLAFNEGPRGCLGMRFAITQMKVAIIALLSNFKIENHEKTISPLGINPTSLIRAPTGGFWFRFKEL